MKKTLLIPAIPAALLAGCSGNHDQPQKPNIIVILADDLGFGDVSAYGSTTISTPNIDRLANEGVCFTNGYATSATSTPSRYALMTGMYPWRNSDVRILPGDAPLVISPEQYTMPAMMQANGYHTAAIGKWHLGMGEGNVDWNKRITPGANEIGFDYSCLIAATNDRVPTVYVENGQVVGLDPNDRIEVDYENNFEGEPTALTNPEMLKMMWDHGHNYSIVNGIPRIGYMKGGHAARWVDEDMADYFMGKVKDFIGSTKDKPFFLFYGLHQPHVPRAPHQRFVGSTTMGARGDAIMEADWCVGELMAYLESEGLLENTLIIFSSDNGPVLNDGYKDFAKEMAGSHDPMGGLRGGKYSLFDAGTHVPLFVYWKGKIEPGISDELISQLDLPASLAKLTGGNIPDNLDSEEHLDTFMGKKGKGRDNLVLEAQGKLAFRAVDWAMIPPYKGEERNITGNEIGNLPGYGLYDLKNDPAQRVNLAETHPGKLDSFKKQFLAIAGAHFDPEAKDRELK
ncbi:sulfatase-like hydrolase/transferase [Dysgonomonas sp. 511]|uniref:sulfatase-like hydrolase/transferase n=1 Tax=Dysgonomonas sp. 511 TaxID=2302930 RepID=UPI0013D45910|nr:arylsulfatase [Dysgonomonas sp. 511]